MKNENYIGLIGGVWLNGRGVQAYGTERGVTLKVETPSGQVFGEKTVGQDEFRALEIAWSRGYYWGDASIALRAMGYVMDWEAA